MNLLFVKTAPANARHVANYCIGNRSVELEFLNGGMDMTLPSKATLYSFLTQKRLSLKAVNIYVITSDHTAILPTNNVYMIENEKPILLGISGGIGCGKSTAVEYLAKKYGFSEYMFAKPLKDIAVTLGFEKHQIFGTQEQKLEINKFWGISGRQFMQVFGSEVCRDYMPKVLPNMRLNGLTMWARLFEKYMGENAYCNVAVSDVRFPDECSIIKKYGGLVIRIERPINNQASAVHTHQSETQQIANNITVYNTGSLDDLYRKLDLMMYRIINGSINTEATNIVL